jgi:hypothetical protein
MNRPDWNRLMVAGAMVVTGATAAAQVVRDPTAVPPEAAPSSGTAAAGTSWSVDGLGVVVREGKPYLVSGTRLYGVGQKLGQFRIDRITETEIWLRSGNEVRKMPRFSGVQRKISAESKGSNP